MRYGRKIDGERVLWLVRFLETWCSDADFDHRINSFISKINAGDLSEDNKEFFSELYTSMEKLSPKLKVMLRSAVPAKMSEKIKLQEDELIAISGELMAEKKFKELVLEFLKLPALSENGKEGFLTVLDSYRLNDFAQYREFVLNQLHVVASLKKDYEISTNSSLIVFNLHTCTTLIELGFSNNNISPADVLDVFIYCIGIYGKYKIEEPERKLISIGLMMLLLLKQYNGCKRVFDEVNSVDLKELCKAIYYANVYFTQGPESDEFKRIGDEMKESVMSIVFYVMKKQHEIAVKETL